MPWQTRKASIAASVIFHTSQELGMLVTGIREGLEAAELVSRKLVLASTLQARCFKQLSVDDLFESDPLLAPYTLRLQLISMALNNKPASELPTDISPYGALRGVN